MHGVWWVGHDTNKAVKRCNELAALDCDSHHKWQVLKFVEPNDDDPSEWGDGTGHEIVYETDKGQQTGVINA